MSLGQGSISFSSGQAGSFTLTASGGQTTLVDGQTLFFLTDQGQLSLVIDQKTVTMMKDCELKSILVESFSTTSGTAERWDLFIRVNNTVDFLIASVSAATSKRLWVNTGISIRLNAGDTIVIKSVNPTWATNPSATRFTGYLIFNG